jgi:hypothetical protein
LLLRLHKPAEAEATGHEALAVAQKVWGATQPKTLEIFRDLINALFAQQKSAELDRLFAEVLPPEPELKPEQASLLYERCDTHARRGRWREAAADAAILLKQSPDNHDNYHLLAPLLVQLGDLPEYQKLCRTMLDKFSGTTDMFVADRMAKDCLMLASSGVDPGALTALADVALTRGSNAAAAPYFKFCKGLAEYRLGHYEVAMSWARAAAAGPFGHAKACAFAIIAMAQFKQNHMAEAREALSECGRTIESQSPKPGQDLGRDWRDWIVDHVLQSEAMRLIGGEPASDTRP